VLCRSVGVHRCCRCGASRDPPPRAGRTAACRRAVASPRRVGSCRAVPRRRCRGGGGGHCLRPRAPVLGGPDGGRTDGGPGHERTAAACRPPGRGDRDRARVVGRSPGAARNRLVAPPAGRRVSGRRRALRGPQLQPDADLRHATRPADGHPRGSPGSGALLGDRATGPDWSSASPPRSCGPSGNPQTRSAPPAGSLAPATPPGKLPEIRCQAGRAGPPEASMAAPTIPASLRSAAGTMGVRRSSSGRNLSAFLLTPPPTTKRSGQNRFSRVR
jgi:hypothetical protein